MASIFRNSASYVDRYFAQVNALREHFPVRLVIAEGDSRDDTYSRLAENLEHRDVLLKVDHGGPEFGSVDLPPRWAQIAYVCNTVLDHLRMSDDDKLVYVESDLGWPVDTMLRINKNLDVVGACAAMSLQPSGAFYDTWGHVGLDGVPFAHRRPFHDSLRGVPAGKLVPVRSAGSCVAVRGDIVNAGVRFSNEDCIRGFCRTIRDHGALWLDTGAEVTHG